MEKAYSRIKWENYPSVVTPLNEANLNKMDVALNEVDNRVLGLDTAKLDKSTANTMIKDISFVENTGIFTITLLNGTKKTIDTKLEKIATNFSYDYQTQKLKLTLIDGTVQQIDLSSLISQLEFIDSDTIDITVDSSGKVSAIVKDGSITENKLQPNFLADVKVEVAKAKSSSDSAYENATTARESATAAEQFRNEAEQFRNQAEAVSGVTTATTEKAGVVKPDGDTIRVDPDGTIHADRGTTSYTDLDNKPKINDVVLEGNKTIDDLGGLTVESTVSFSQASERTNIEATDNVKGIFGKVKKWFADLKPHAFSNPTNNLLATEAGTALDAVQGKVLYDRITNTNVSRKTAAQYNTLEEFVEDTASSINVPHMGRFKDLGGFTPGQGMWKRYLITYQNVYASGMTSSLNGDGLFFTDLGEVWSVKISGNRDSGVSATYEKLVTETALNDSLKVKFSHKEYIPWTTIESGSYAEGVKRFTKSDAGQIREFIVVLQESGLYGGTTFSYEYAIIKTGYSNLQNGYYQTITSKGTLRIYYSETDGYIDIRELPQGLRIRAVLYLPRV